jgi:NADH-quinone oxidoreductase subunit N
MPVLADSYLRTLAPELALMVAAGVALIVGLAERERVRRWVAPLALIGTCAALLLSWRVSEPELTLPVGLRVTSLVWYTRLVVLSVGSLLVLVNWRQPLPHERGEYFCMLLLSLAGIDLVAMAEDLVVLFLAIELVSVPTYILVALSRNDVRSSEAGMKYFFLGALAAGVLAYGFSFIYGATGSTSLLLTAGGMSGILDVVQSSGMAGGLLTIGLVLSIGALAFKIAAVPLHFYAPDVYAGAGTPITATLGFVPKIAGFVALAKLLSAVGWNWNLMPGIYWMLWLMAAATMILGNVLALLQSNVKRMLAYSSIAHSGYMLIAMLVGPNYGEGPLHDGVAAMLFYVAAYGVMNLGAFAVLAYVRREDGSEIEDLEDLGGLWQRDPPAAAAMVVCAFSLLGMPPTVGFFGKVFIFIAAFSLPAEDPHAMSMIALAILGVITTAIGAAYYLRIVAACLIGERTREIRPVPNTALQLGMVMCWLIVLAVGIFPLWLHSRSSLASASLTAGRPDARAVALELQESNDALPQSH